MFNLAGKKENQTMGRLRKSAVLDFGEGRKQFRGKKTQDRKEGGGLGRTGHEIGGGQNANNGRKYTSAVKLVHGTAKEDRAEKTNTPDIN